MSHVLPFPVVSLILAVLWLLLNQSVAPADLLLGATLGIALPLLTRRLQPLGYPRMRAPLVLVRLLGMALVEVFRSCFNVCRIILFADYQYVNSQFIRVPLTIRDPYGLAMLSCLINMTPGTVWVEILPGEHALALHVFDLHDEQWWIAMIQTKYEEPLRAIFEPEAADGDTA